MARWALRGSLTLLLRWSHWRPFAALGVAQGAFLALVLGFYSTALLPFMLPLNRLLGGEGAVHYPILYYLLPLIFQRGNMAINVLLASLALGAATILFARAYGFVSGRSGSSWRLAWNKAPLLIGAALIETLLQYGLMESARLVPQRLFLENAMVRWGTRGTVLGLSILIQCLFVYATAWIVLMNRGIVAAIRDSVRVAVRTFVPTAIVVAIPALVMFPLSYVAGRADVIAEKFKPELMTSLMVVQIVLQLFLTFVLVGAVTRLFVWRTEASK